MKLKYILTTAILALASSASSNAGTTSYNDGDLLLGFRMTAGSTSDYLVDIGQGYDFSKSFTLNTGNIANDLASTFGAGWYTSTSLKWSIVGTLSYNNDTGEQNLIYTTNPSSTSWKQSFDQSTASSAITSVASYFNGKASTSNNSNGVVQTVSASDFTYGNNQPGGTISGNISFSTWAPTNEASPSSSLYLDQLNEGSISAGTTLGRVALGNDGSLNFQAVPEPSTYAMLGLGSIGLLIMLRRRVALA
jgi:PEP-CTERM motif